MSVQQRALSIEIQQENNNAEKSPQNPTITQIPSVDSEEVTNIKLNKHNTCIARYPNQQKAIILWDSGASLSLISEGVIKNNSYLSSLPIVKHEKTHRFIVGGGTYIHADRTITFSIYVQKTLFEITAFIVPCIGGVDILLSTRAMKDLEATLCFRKNILRFKTKTVAVKINRNTILKPGESRILTIGAKLPDIIKSAEVYFKASKFLSQFLPELMLIKMRKGVSKIAVYNKTNKIVRIKCCKPIGSILLSHFGCVPTITGDVEFTQESAPHAYIAAPTHKTCNTRQNGESQTNNNNKNQNDLYKLNHEKYPHLEKDDPRLYQTPEEILKMNLDMKGHVMSPKIEKQFWEIIMKNKSAFATYDEVGECPDMTVKVKLTDETPFFIRPYPASENCKELIDKEISKLVKMGILEYGKGSHVSPMMLLKKKESGTYRLVSDFRHLNSRIAPLHSCTPLLREALQIIGGSNAQIFSCLDIKHAFYSLKIDPSSRKYLTIAPYASGRTLWYKRLPQGLNISPTEWNDKITEILEKIPNHIKFSLNIADDVILYSDTPENHIDHINQILKLFAENGLRISVPKCKFFRTTVNYMGHVIKIHKGRPSMKPQKSKIEAISKMTSPKTVRQLKGFIGMVAYLSCYINKLQILLTPMHALTRKNTPYIWTPEIQANFEKIKSLLINAPLLSLPTKDGKFILYVDSSKKGTGSTLVQIQDGEEKIVAFYSKKLPNAVERYSISELEGYGCLINIKAYRYLLRNVPFDIFTDHSALVQIAKSKNEPVTLRMKKILEKLSDYQFTLRYFKGKDLVISDYFSRYPTVEVDDDDPIAFTVIKTSLINSKKGQKHNVGSSEGMNRKQQKTLCKGTLKPLECTCCHAHGNSKTCKTCAYNIEKRLSDLELALPAITRARRTAEEPLLEGLAPPTRRRRARPAAAAVEMPPQAADPDGRGPDADAAPPAPHDVDNADRRLDQINMDEPVVSSSDDDEEGPAAPQPQLDRNRLLQQPIQPPQYNLRPGRNRLIDQYRHIEDQPVQFRDYDPMLDRTPMHEIVQPEEHHYNAPSNIFAGQKDINLFHKNIPKQKDLDRMSKLIKTRIITDTYLSFTKAQLAKEQAADPFFKPIINWLKFDHLPDRKAHQRKVMTLSEDFVIVDDILFKLKLNNKKPDGTTEPFRVVVCIPQTRENLIFFQEHEGLTSSHMGIQKTFLTIKNRYYIHGLFKKLVHYIRSCINCQCRKTPKDLERPWEINIPTEYVPFQIMYSDIKHMYTSSMGSNYLLVVCCDITRYIEAIPLKRIDAPTITEALLRRIILRYGAPKVMIVDQDRGFLNEISQFLWKVTGTTIKVISPQNHQSHKVERSIQSISNLLCSHLTGFGRNWDLYIESSTFSYNSHIIPNINVSPYYLVYLREPPKLCNLEFTPMEEIKNTYHEYIEFLKNRLENVGKYMLKTQAQLQTIQSAKQMEKVKEPTKYKVGLIVFLLSPGSSHLQTKSMKFNASYLGPLFINQILGFDKAILHDMEGRPLHGLFHVNRLKPGYIRLKHGSASTMEELQKEMTNLEIASLKHRPFNPIDNPPDTEHMVLTILKTNDNQLTPASATLPIGTHIVDNSQTTPVDLKPYIKFSTCNEHFGSNKALTERQIKSLKIKNLKMPKEGSEMIISKFRFKNGYLEVLAHSAEKGNNYAMWFAPHLHPSCCENISKYLETNKPIIIGTPGKLARDLYLKGCHHHK